MLIQEESNRIDLGKTAEVATLSTRLSSEIEALRSRTKSLETTSSSKADALALGALSKRVDEAASKHNTLRAEFNSRAETIDQKTTKHTSDLDSITTRMEEAESSLTSLTNRTSEIETGIKTARDTAKNEAKAIHKCIARIGDIGCSQVTSMTEEFTRIRQEISQLDGGIAFAAQASEEAIYETIAKDRKEFRVHKTKLQTQHLALAARVQEQTQLLEDLETISVVNAGDLNHIRQKTAVLSSSHSSHAASIQQMIAAITYLQFVITPLHATATQTSSSLGQLSTNINNHQRSINTIESTATALATTVDTIDKSLKSVDGKASSTQSRSNVAERLAVSSKIQSLLAQSEVSTLSTRFNSVREGLPHLKKDVQAAFTAVKQFKTKVDGLGASYEVALGKLGTEITTTTSLASNINNAITRADKAADTANSSATAGEAATNAAKQSTESANSARNASARATSLANAAAKSATDAATIAQAAGRTADAARRGSTAAWNRARSESSSLEL